MYGRLISLATSGTRPERKTSLLTLEIHMQIHSRGDVEANPPGEPYNFTADTHMLRAHKGKYCKDEGVTLTPLPQKIKSFC